MLVSTQPITIDGETYNNYILQMSISDVCMGNNKVTNTNTVFKPVRIDGDGNYIVCENPQYWKQVLVNDISEYTDTATQICFGKCFQAIQEFLITKGW